VANGDETQAMPPEPERFEGGDDGDGDDGEGRRSMLWYLVGAGLLVGVLAGALVAILAGGDDSVSTEQASATSSTSSTTRTTGVPVTAPPQTSPKTNPTTTNPQNQPKVDSFAASPNFITCANELDSKSVTLSWTTTNATQVVLSVDGPGAYGTYGPDASQSVGYPCPPKGQQATHSYLITAENGSAQVQKSITVSSTTVP